MAVAISSLIGQLDLRLSHREIISGVGDLTNYSEIPKPYISEKNI